MKKLLACIFALVLCISLFGCTETVPVSPGSTESKNTATEMVTETTNANTETESTENTMATEETSETASTTETTAATEATQATEAVQNHPDDVQVTKVWIPTKGGKKYHSKSSCSGMEEPDQVTQFQAEQQGFTPCKKCYK